MSIRGMPAYFSDYWRLKSQKPKDGKVEFANGALYPCLGDRYVSSGQARGPYFHQDLLVAGRIFENKPLHHIDVGSRVDGFVAHVASFRQISVIDIRPLDSQIKNIAFLQADVMNELPSKYVQSCDSLSCLHALEHFGLGRYGDPVRWDGYLIGFNNLLTLLRSGGRLYFSVPIGRPRIEFNAHRVFSLSHLMKMFEGQLKVDSFSYVDDNGDLHENTQLSERSIQTNCECDLGCGIFELTKL